MSKYTPGPWEFSGSMVVDAKGGYVCQPTYRKDRAALANARLIAAAPDLLVALKEYLGPDIDLTTAPCHVGITTPDKCGRCSREIAARAAIAKAEGRPA